MTFVIDRAGITGDDGPSHHGLLDLAYLRCIPDMVVAAPSSPDEMRRMLATALAHDGTVRLPLPARRRSEHGDAPLEPFSSVEAVVRREGTTSPSSRSARWWRRLWRHRPAARPTGSAPPWSTPGSSSRSTPALGHRRPPSGGAHGRGRHPGGRLWKRGCRAARGCWRRGAAPEAGRPGSLRRTRRSGAPAQLSWDWTRRASPARRASSSPPQLETELPPPEASTRRWGPRWSR